jgi:hypothetical protein
VAQNPNLPMLETVATGLGDLLADVVFVGGTIIAFYVDDAAAPPVRATEDVDCIVSLQMFGGYRPLEKRLEALGFHHDTSRHAPICRWIYKSIIVDVMPDDEIAYGFTNPWYREALQNPTIECLPGGSAIRILSIPYFLATKFQAHNDRGGDPYASRDFEDIITVLDGCTDIETRLPKVGTPLGDYLKAQFDVVIAGDDEVIEASIGGSPKTGRVERIKTILTNVYGLSW